MRSIIAFITIVLISTCLWAQTPHKMSYQAVIRNTNGELVKERQISMRISIIHEEPEGTVIYSEVQTPYTNANGLVSITVGGEEMINIDWSDGPYFLKTETDLGGGDNYNIVGTSQLLSVPFAFHATSAETLTTPIEETDPVFSAWDKSEGIVITEAQISDLKAYLTEEADPVFSAWDRSEGIVITENQISDLQDYITSISEESLGDLRDVDLTGLEEGMVISYNQDEQKWMAIPLETFYEEVDPVFNASAAKNITYDEIGLWNNKQDGLKGAERGEMLFFTGSSWYSLPPGQQGQTLTFCNGIPHWGPCPQGNLYTLTLEANENQGTLFGQGTYPENATVYIDWDSENSNYTFEKWVDQSGLIGWPSNESTNNPVNFNMPDNDITIRAELELPAPLLLYYGAEETKKFVTGFPPVAVTDFSFIILGNYSTAGGTAQISHPGQVFQNGLVTVDCGATASYIVIAFPQSWFSGVVQLRPPGSPFATNMLELETKVYNGMIYRILRSTGDYTGTVSRHIE